MQAPPAACSCHSAWPWSGSLVPGHVIGSRPPLGTTKTAPTNQKGFGVHGNRHNPPPCPPSQAPVTLTGGSIETAGAARTETSPPAAHGVARGGRPRRTHGSRSSLPKYYSTPGRCCPSRSRLGSALGHGRALWEEALPSPPPTHPGLSGDIGPSQGAYQCHGTAAPHPETGRCLGRDLVPSCNLSALHPAACVNRPIAVLL